MKVIFSKYCLSLLLLSVLFCVSVQSQSISKNGYPEHFVAGVIIGGSVSYYTYKKTDNKLKAWLYGVGASAGAGLLKEIVDPVLFNGVRNMRDFQYTALGGGVGASIVIPLGRKKEDPLTTLSIRGY